jgi:hypothetical protein
MVKVVVAFGTNSYMDHVSCHLYVTIEREKFKMTSGEDRLVFLLNKYARSIVIGEYGYGYEADVPENVALALKYLAYIEKKPSIEELEDIVATGTTKLHIFLHELGVEVQGKDIRNVFGQFVKTGNFLLTFKSFPSVFLDCPNLEAEKAWGLKFDASDVEPGFLTRMLHDEASEGEVEMVKGVSLLGQKAQDKYMHLLTTGHLTMDKLAGGMYRSAISSKDKCAWKKVAEWLKNNGYSEKSSEVIARKTLCN